MDECSRCKLPVMLGYCCQKCGDYTCEDCLDEILSKGIITTKYRCPSCTEWAMFSQYIRE